MVLVYFEFSATHANLAAGTPRNLVIRNVDLVAADIVSNTTHAAAVVGTSVSLLPNNRYSAQLTDSLVTGETAVSEDVTFHTGMGNQVHLPPKLSVLSMEEQSSSSSSSQSSSSSS